MNIVFHKELAEGKWFHLPLVEQLANIGSEVGRAAMWQGKNKERFERAVERALELFDLTLADARWRGRLKEIARARELFCAAALGSKEYAATLQDLEKYFLPFAFAARKDVA
ncbi:MAG: hypothetical protein A2672_02405 [Candidatus Wildermuthbacteria bacterium RIFCSPHIGHO2_01_FULL_49_22b]|uniref:Uncharacterized protein n=1 Tax=Candidatus Wildermuthbacteria bacterium RIFCSPHIGHO2_01_FULL_49_22b TaxID=1802448 RepID=A0A1G2QWU1_9BACT|nr:MAG: hypothetical protein A2672_02405 [Candidatus Wildermuthbacteria bacterium RIFCSPHIGHO2_01_FULL_49_22b]